MDCAMSQPPSRPVSGSERTCADSGLVTLLPQPSSSFSTPKLTTHTPPPAAVAAAAPSTLHDAESPIWHLNDAPRAPATAGATTGNAANSVFCSAKQQPQQQQQQQTTTAESATAWTPFPLPPSFTVSGGRTHTPPPPPPPVAPSHLHHAFMLPPPAPCVPTSAAAQQRRVSLGSPANCDFAQRLRSAVHQQRSGVGCPLADAPKSGVTPARMRGRATSAVVVVSAAPHDTATSSSASSCDEDDTAVSAVVAGTGTETCSMPLATFESMHPATTTPAGTATIAGVPTAEHSQQHQATVKNGSAVLTPPLAPQTHQHPQQQLSSMSSVPSLSAPAAACHQRQPSPKVTALLGGDGHLVDTFNVSSLAQYAFSRSIASITTRPPATASNELVRRKVDGTSYINHYRVIRTLGRGACGKVKLAFDEEEKKMVAIKAVKRADTRKRIGGMTLAQKQYNAFMREVEVMKKLRHRNIVSLYEVIDDPSADKLYLVMQYVDKGVVAKVEVRANSDFVCDPVPPPQLARYAREMLTGLQYLHRHDVVHRDLKPDNILVSKDGHAYLADFGVAETFDTSYRQRMETLMAQSMAMSTTMSGAGGRVGGPQVLGTKGTPLFIAPELWDGAKSYGKPVDMWAMGVTLFTLLVGKLPFRSPEDITDVNFTPVVPVAYGDKWLALLAGLLNRSPTARWTVEKARAFVRYYLDNSASPPSEMANRPAGTAATATPTLAPPHAPSTSEGRVLLSGSTPSFTDTQKACNHPTEPRRTGSLLTPSVATMHDEKQVSLSDTGSHVFAVEFLPMPEGTDEVLSPELTSAAAPALSTPALHFMPAVLAIAPATTANDGDDEHGGEDGADDADAGPALSGLGSAFGSPFDTSPALARVMSDTFTPGRTTAGSSGLNSNNVHLLLSSPNVCAQSNTLAALPPMLSLQRSGASQMGISDAAAATAPRGRRTHHRRGNGSTLNSNSNMNAATLNSANNASFGARGNTRGRSREGVVDGLAVLGISRGNTGGATRVIDAHAASRRVISPHETPSLMSDTSSATSAGAPLTTSPSSPFPPSSVESAMNADGVESGGEEKPFAPHPQPPQCQQNDPHLSNRRHIFSASASAGRSAPAVPSSGMVCPTSQNNAISAMENGPFAAGGGAAASRGGKAGGGQHPQHHPTTAQQQHRSQRIQSVLNSEAAGQEVNRVE